MKEDTSTFILFLLTIIIISSFILMVPHVKNNAAISISPNIFAAPTPILSDDIYKTMFGKGDLNFTYEQNYVIFHIIPPAKRNQCFCMGTEI
jgi:hypothetical protein